MAFDPKDDLRAFLERAWDALLWKTDGVSEYDVRRPMTPTGTNLLGLVKHVASVSFGYFGDVLGRPTNESLPWFDEGAEQNADMWATADETRAEIMALGQRAKEHSLRTVDELPLDTIGSVPWWPENRREVTLQYLIVHMVAELNRHAGHADIVRELIDRSVGLRADNDNMAEGDSAWWTDYYARLELAARAAG